jgi:uncharacterized protein involved in exopolysaccharide biosynthesis
MLAALKAQALQLRLDEVHPHGADDAGNVLDSHSQPAGLQQRPASGAGEATPLKAELDHLERARQLARARFVDLQRKLDQIGLSARLHPLGAGSRSAVDASKPPRTAESRSRALVSIGAAAGFLLGLLLGALRELGGNRMRSRREAEWALGAPVLGVIPSLSAKARDACFRPPPSAPDAAPAELA